MTYTDTDPELVTDPIRIKKALDRKNEQLRLVEMRARELASSQPLLMSQKSKGEKKQVVLDLLKDVEQSGIDIELFDTILTNEINRSLKAKFSGYFAILAVFSLVVSYLIVVLIGVGVIYLSDTIVTALIIQAPIQLIGILVIIAKNLFPSQGT